jgi:hypothetical protein
MHTINYHARYLERGNHGQIQIFNQWRHCIQIRAEIDEIRVIRINKFNEFILILRQVGIKLLAYKNQRQAMIFLQKALGVEMHGHKSGKEFLQIFFASLNSQGQFETNLFFKHFLNFPETPLSLSIRIKTRHEQRPFIYRAL